MEQLFRELKRRNVYKVGVSYLVAAFVVVQFADLAADAFGLPGWFEPMVWVLCGLGFPMALVIAWAFELTPDGMRRTPEAEASGGSTESAESPRSGSRLALKALVGLGLVGAAVAGGWYLMGGGGETEPRAGKRSVAVLPFEALSSGEESRTFARGIHDDLLTRLSNVSKLEVISRTSVERYRDSDLPLPAIADSLGVTWVVEGGVQHMGDQIQVNAQLIDPRTDTHEWADSYRRELSAEELFALQTEITKRIAGSLEAELTPGEAARVGRQPTGDLQAYEHYVQGRRHYRRKDIREALEAFTLAVEQDSGFAAAWAGLADAAVELAGEERSPGDSALIRARAAAERALELDPELAEAHASIGHLLMERHEGPVALGELERALELKPSYVQAHVWTGQLEAALGRPEVALRHQRRAVELNPLAPNAQDALSRAHLYVGDYERALEQALRAKQVEPGHYSTILPAYARIHLGRRDSLLEDRKDYEGDWFVDGFGLLEHVPAALGIRVVARRLEGDTARARSLLDRLAPRARPLARALAHGSFGEVDAAYRALEDVDWTSLSPVNTAYLRYLWPRQLEGVREDPRWKNVLARLNEAWGLNPDGSLPDSLDVTFGPRTGR